MMKKIHILIFLFFLAHIVSGQNKDTIKYLEEVSIEAKRTSFEIKSGERIVKVGQDLKSTSNSARDLLNNLPSIEVDPRGNLAIRGQNNVRIFINGQPTSLTSIELLNMLSSTIIDNIYFISSVSAGELPDGLSGIMNINTIKSDRITVNASIGTGEKYNTGISGGYTKNKFSINAAYNFFQNKTDFSGNIVQESAGKTSQQNVDGYFWGNIHDIKLNISQKFNSTSALYHNLSCGIIQRTSPIDIVDDNFTSHAGPNANMLLLVNTLKFDHAFNKKNKIFLSANFELNNTNNTSSYNMDLTRPMPIKITNTSNSKSNYSAFSFRADYQNSGDKYVLSAGFTSNIRSLDNPYHSESTSIVMGRPMPSTYDTHYKNKEIVSGIYANYKYIFNKKIEASLGLRLDYADTMVKSLEQNKDFPTNSWDLYPTLNLLYSFSNEHKLMLSYSRRVARPDSRQLSPNPIYSNPSRPNIGNPFLKPQYANIVEVSDVLRWSSGSLSSSAYFRSNKDVIQPYLSVENPVTGLPERGVEYFNTYKNFGFAHYMGIEFIANQRIAKFLSINGSINAYYVHFDISKNALWNSSGVNYSAKLSTNFTFGKHFSAMILGRYRGQETNIQSIKEAGGAADIGFRYEALNNRLAISLNVNDILNTEKHRSVAYIEQNGVISKEINTETFESRVGFLSVSFKF